MLPIIYNNKYFLESCDGHDLWEKSFGRQLVPRFEYALKIAGLKKGEKVLDFGCGRGEMIVQSAMAGCKATGVDYSPQAIALTKKAIAKNNLSSIKVFLAKDSKLLFEKESFDVVFFLDVAEHLDDGQLKNALKEIRRVLKLDGRLIVHTSPNKDWVDKGYKLYTRWANFIASKLIWEPFFKTKLNFQENPRTKVERQVHINEQTTDSLKKALREAGFENTKIWLDSKFRITSKGFWFQYTFLQPIWLPVLGKYFSSDIWVIARI